MTTTNNRVREHFEGDDPYVETASPGNGAATAVSEEARQHVVNPDGTNTVDLDAGATVRVRAPAGQDVSPGEAVGLDVDEASLVTEADSKSAESQG